MKTISLHPSSFIKRECIMLIESVILIAIGFILLFIELFILPSFGPVGMLGGVLIIAGIIIAGYKEGVQTAIVYSGVTLGVSLPLCAVGFWLIPKTKIGRSLILDTSEHKEKGFRSGTDNLENLMGKTGVAITSLRPAGTVRIENDRLDVLTQGEFIAKGKEVEVIRVEGNKIIVKEKSENAIV